MINPRSDISNIPAFFILSRPRTGSTLLRMFFEAHLNIAIPTECPMLIDLYRKYGKVKLWDEKKILKLFKDIQKQWKFNRWDIDPEQLKSNLLQLSGERSFTDFYKTINLSYNSPYKKEEILLVGDKNPRYSIYCKSIMRIFPEAKIIHLTRDYRDQIPSVKKFDFEAPSTSLLAWRWKYVFKKLLKMEIKFPEKFLRIKYEDLMNDPDITLQKACTFLNIPYNSSMLDFYNNEKKYLDKYDDDVFQKYFSNLFTPVKEKDASKTKTPFTLQEEAKAGYIIGKYAKMAGYPQTEVKANIFIRFIVIFPEIYGYLWYMLKYMYDFLPFSIKRIVGFRPVLGFVYNKIMIRKK